jgi:hypothetical protein
MWQCRGYVITVWNWRDFENFLRIEKGVGRGSVAGVLSVEGLRWFFCWWGVNATSEHAWFATANRSKNVSVVAFYRPL